MPTTHDQPFQVEFAFRMKWVAVFPLRSAHHYTRLVAFDPSSVGDSAPSTTVARTPASVTWHRQHTRAHVFVPGHRAQFFNLAQPASSLLMQTGLHRCRSVISQRLSRMYPVLSLCRFTSADVNDEAMAFVSFHHQGSDHASV